MTAYIRQLQRELEQTPQYVLWHGEGNVWNHTLLVCDAVRSLPEYQEADEKTKEILSMAAAFHDIGKISSTRMADGHWTAHGHAKVSSHMARQILWQEHGVCGNADAQRLREAVCGLVRCHGLPVHAIEKEDGKLRLMRFAANGALAPGLTVKNLCALAKADILGRICPDQQELLEKVELCVELAGEAGCYEGPYPFPSDHTLHRTLSGEKLPAVEYPIYNSTWGQVILLAGLPGTGKDTWIRENCPALPVVSLDDLRREMGILPTENQSQVLEAARERAKEYLRKKQPFVWNATNISPMVRSRQVELFANYGAAVRLVYLETGWEEQLRRNRNRKEEVPERVICKMLNTLIPPERYEADRVEWLCV